MKLIDISMTLNNQTPPWPGDHSFHYGLSATMEETGAVNVGHLQMSAHTATHVDAPFHYDNDGLKIADIPVDRFIGDALVVNMEGKDVVTAEDLAAFELTGVSKLLIRSNTWEDRSQFPGDYIVLDENLGTYLKENGIDLIGVDGPSVDPENSKDLKAHQSMNANDVLILEGIVLDHVAPGSYELMAFPLKAEQADGCPVRAVLRQY
ncbi:arylformamidase [Thalassobacillus sp. CUG 92003]|uniref:arylformamidase n=1 Tax=Thalassobacillus sp. CUG 92003 TaxID=2736641 RepID=UPI0015E69FED|nr:arylformamidase [Thalassobacillus sp. CUG 92003]